MYADKVMKNGKVVGVSTSRGYSYYFREMLSLCTLDVACCELGSEVVVIWGNPDRPQKEIRAKVGPAPYKADNRKLDVHSLPPPRQVAQFSPTA
jgi:vanillate/3-O-methylgallate O-demethylase